MAGARVRNGASVRQAGDPRSGKILKLSLESTRFGGTVVLHCPETIVGSSDARALAGLISEVLPTTHRMVVDLTGVLTLDSGALGELVLTHMWAEAAGYALRFACPTPSVRNLLESTNLVSVLDVYASVAEATAAMYHEEVQSA